MTNSERSNELRDSLYFYMVLHYGENGNIEVTQFSDRFVRGDQSRNTEGSGLGLAIVKSFVELQKGTFEIILDGDLFKTVIEWKQS